MKLSKEETFERLKQTKLEILKTYAAFCEEHRIDWWLCSGSALGSKRHGGFIPWDDGVDVGMLRGDYERFLRLAIDENLFPEGYSAHDRRNTRGFAPMFAKVWKDDTKYYTESTTEAGLRQGIYMDVFPFDKACADDAGFKRQLKNAKHWTRKSYLYHAGHEEHKGEGARTGSQRMADSLRHSLAHVSTSDVQIDEGYGRSCCGDIEPGDRVVSLASQRPAAVPLESMLPTSTGTFEGESYPLPGRCCEYLEAVYGDWKQLPEPGERTANLPLLVDFGDGDFYGR